MFAEAKAIAPPDPPSPMITEIIGTFLGSESGVQYRNVALTNDAGDQLITVNLAGKNTLRLKQGTTDSQDFYLKQNYLKLNYQL